MIYLFLVAAMLVAFALAPATIVRPLAQCLLFLRTWAEKVARTCLGWALAPFVLVQAFAMLTALLVLSLVWAAGRVLEQVLAFVARQFRQMVFGRVAKLLSVAALAATLDSQPPQTLTPGPVVPHRKIARDRFLPSPPQHLVNFVPR